MSKITIQLLLFFFFSVWTQNTKKFKCGSYNDSTLVRKDIQGSSSINCCPRLYRMVFSWNTSIGMCGWHGRFVQQHAIFCLIQSANIKWIGLTIFPDCTVGCFMTSSHFQSYLDWINYFPKLYLGDFMISSHSQPYLDWINYFHWSISWLVHIPNHTWIGLTIFPDCTVEFFMISSHSQSYLNWINYFPRLYRGDFHD